MVDLLDGIPMDDRDTKGDLYEYMLGKIAAYRCISLPVQATSSAFGHLLAGTAATANPIEFINHLTEHGAMPAARLYDSPFTDIHAQGPDGIFAPRVVEQLFSALDTLILKSAST